MKNLFTLFLLALLTAPLFAQTNNHAIGYGFTTSAHVVCALGNERFAAGGVGSPAPGALYADTVFALVFNTNGQVEQRIQVPAPAAEVHHVTAIYPLPDGGFVLSVNSTLCDVVSDQHDLFCYTPDGHLRWTKNGLSSFAASPLTVLPDGSVVGVFGNKLKAYGFMNGNLLWQTELEGSAEIYGLAFVPGTEDFVAVGFPNVQYWRQIGAPGSHVYSMDYANNLPSGGFIPKVRVFDGKAYCLNMSNHSFIRFDEDSYEVLAALPYYPVDFGVADNGFWFIGKNNLNTTALKTDQHGQFLISWGINAPWLSGNALAVEGTYVALAGANGSGPEDDQIIPEYKGIHAWLSTVDADTPTFALQHNASLKAVEQNSPVHAEELVAPGIPFPVYQLSGGNFRVEVTNTGNTTLQSVDVMISFENNIFWDICFFKPAIRRHYTGLDLAPGQSVWLDFGDIDASGQASIPVQFCFWTAAPNEAPDADLSDDTFCHAIILDANPPLANEVVRLFPNPTGNAGVYAECAEPGAIYQLFDTSGRLVGDGQWPAGQHRVLIPTQALSPGFYFIQTGKWRGKLVVKR